MSLKVVRIILFFVIISCCTNTVLAYQKSAKKSWITFENSSLPDLPDSLGLSGAFIGPVGDMVIVAGGSNFDQPVWEGGSKKYHDSIYLLMEENESFHWQDAGTLPYPAAHGATVSVNDGLILLGGENESEKLKDVLYLKWNELDKSISISRELPPLPREISYASASILNNSIYIAGGTASIKNQEVPLQNFWKLNLGGNNEWQELTPWPGKERFGASLVKQFNGEYECLFLFSGKSDTDYLTDAYMYDPAKSGMDNSWKKLTALPRPAHVASVLPVGSSQILVISGSDGHDTGRVLELGYDYKFTNTVLSYNTITDTWREAGEISTGLVGTSAIYFRDRIVIPGGEINPSVRTTKIYTASVPALTKSHLKGLDYAVIVIYLVLIIVMGYYFSYYNKTTDDYFLGGRKMPFWAAGLSLMATQASAIGFMSVPAKAFATNWSYFAGAFTWVIVVPIVIYAFVPFYRRLNVVSAYEYLEKRFNNIIRKFIAGLYLLFQLIGRMGVIIYLPAIALSAVTGIDARVCIIVIGILATAYTALGGMHAVIWTDVLQAIVLFGGIIVCIIYILLSIDGGFGEFIRIANESQKFSLGSMDWSYVAPVFWIVIIGNIFNRTGLLVSDQSSVQRYLTTRDEKETAKALWASVAANIPWAVLVFGLGTAIFVFYKVNPGLIDPSLSNDGIVPFFIAQNLPPGITGLLIAGIFAASMSSVDSSIHSSTTVLMRDFLQGTKALNTEAKKLSLSRFLTLGLGLMSTITAVLMTFFEITSIWDVILEFASLFTGAMTGMFILGIFSIRANGTGAIIGAIGSALILLYVRNYTPIHFFLYSGIGIISSVVIGYVASLPFKSGKSLDGLTIYTMPQKNENS